LFISSSNQFLDVEPIVKGRDEMGAMHPSDLRLWLTVIWSEGPQLIPWGRSTGPSYIHQAVITGDRVWYSSKECHFVLAVRAFFDLLVLKGVGKGLFRGSGRYRWCSWRRCGPSFCVNLRRHLVNFVSRNIWFST
jgi:hypothetical protein